MTASPKSSVAAQLAALPGLPQDRLWVLWDEHFTRRPKRVQRRYLEARLAYRLQEIALGGLPPTVKVRRRSRHIWPTAVSSIPRSRSDAAPRCE